MVKNDTDLAGASQQNDLFFKKRTYAPNIKNKLCFKEANQIQGSTNQTKKTNKSQVFPYNTTLFYVFECKIIASWFS